METVDGMNPEIERILQSKEERRRRLAALPFPEKVRIVVRMQRMAAPILKTRGRSVRVWQIDDGQPSRESESPALETSGVLKLE